MSADVRFQIFGEVAAFRSEEPIKLRGLIGKAWLAALLVNHGEYLTRDTVAGWVYQERRDETLDVSGSAASNVSYLKSKLETAPGLKDGVEVKDTMLRLQLGSRELDLVRFRSLAAEGKSAVESSAWEEAHQLLGEALKIARDPPFPELLPTRFPFLAQYREDLEAERFDARLLYLRAEVATGPTSSTVQELRKLRRAPGHLSDERIWELLIRAVEVVEGSSRALATYLQAEEAFQVDHGAVPAALRKVGTGVNQRATGEFLSDEPVRLEIIARRLPTPSALLPDVLTPGVSVDGFLAAWKGAAGSEVAHRLLQLHGDAVASVANGDFVQQQDIGRALIKVGEAAELNDVEATGYYFSAEGLRLRADLAAGVERERLRREAFETYSRALELQPASIRSERGRARLYEVQGDLAHAGPAIERVVHAIQLEHHTVPIGSMRSLGIQHELLRATRHRVYCLADIVEASPGSSWSRTDKLDQLRGYIVESENLHRELMPSFGSGGNWWRIEWFVAGVMFARAWAQTGDCGRAMLTLLAALKRRREMLVPQRAFTDIELANLQWWCTTATVCISTNTNGTLRARVDELKDVLAQREVSQIVPKVDAVLALGAME